jgi:surface antigen
MQWFANMISPRSSLFCFVLGSLLTLSSCASTSGTRAASFLDALQGGMAGRVSGVKLSDGDRTKALEAEYKALESAASGQEVVWTGSQATGRVVAAAPFQVGSQNCRQYSQNITVAGKMRMAAGHR